MRGVLNPTSVAIEVMCPCKDLGHSSPWASFCDLNKILLIRCWASLKYFTFRFISGHEGGVLTTIWFLTRGTTLFLQSLLPLYKGNHYWLLCKVHNSRCFFFYFVFSRQSFFFFFCCIHVKSSRRKLFWARRLTCLINSGCLHFLSRHFAICSQYSPLKI